MKYMESMRVWTWGICVTDKIVDYYEFHCEG